MTNKQVVDKVNLWQNAGFVHPLTCGKNSRHRDLVPEERRGKVVLTCPNCDYIQNWIPDYVLTNYVEVVQAAMKKADEPKKVNLAATLTEQKDGAWFLKLSSTNRESMEQFNKMRNNFAYYRDHGLILIFSEAGLILGDDKTTVSFKIYGGPDIVGSEEEILRLARFKERG